MRNGLTHGIIMSSGRQEPQVKGPLLAHRAASGAIWIALETASTQLVSLLVFAIIAHFVTPHDFGLMSISYLAIYSLKPLIIDNVVVAVSRKKETSDLEYSTSFWLTLALAAIASLCVFVVAGLAENLMNAPGLEEVLRAMSVILLFMGLARTHEMRLMRSFQFRSLALRSILGTIVGGGIGIILAARGYGLKALVVQQIATSGISLALLWSFSSWSPSFRVSKEASRETLIFMRSITPLSVSYVVSQSCDTFLVGYFFGPASVGLYAIAKRLRLALQSVAASPINGVLFSTLAEVQDDRERLKYVSQRLIALISLICAPIFAGSSSIAPEAISVGFGDQWTAAGPIFAVLTLGGFFAALQSFTDTVFVIKNRQSWSFHLLLIQTALAVLFFFPSKSLGPEYMAVPFVAPYAITLPLSAILFSRLTGFSLYQWLVAVTPSLASAGLMFAAVKLLGYSIHFSTNLWHLAVCAIVGAFAYLVAILILDRNTVTFAFHTLWKLVR
jgi:O-antigen/teichoic acid export membrane protein